MFSENDGLCHDIYDAVECKGGRRLFYTAYGSPICDCPIGQYPFPNAADDCVPLFSRGSCAPGQVVSVLSSGALGCARSQCPLSVRSDDQFARYVDGYCYQLGLQGPCSHSQLFGYDVFQRRAQCAEVVDSSSPYGLSDEESALLDSTYNQRYEYDDVRVLFGDHNDQLDERQETNALGIIRLPVVVNDVLLPSCRPGSRTGNNYKCTNPLV